MRLSERDGWFKRHQMSEQDVARHPRRGEVLRHAPTPAAVDEKGLRRALKKAIEGEVRFDAGSKALYATDGSNYRMVPIGVVIPRSLEDVVETVRVCREFGAPITSRGGGTSLAGQTCNAAIVIDWSKHVNQLLEINPEKKTARVRPGIVLDDLRKQATKQGLTFGPDPATHDHCTLGGMIGNNSCGVHAQMAGRTSDNVRSLEVLTWSGHRFRVGPTPEDELQRIIGQGGFQGLLYARLKALRDRYADEVRARYPDIPRRVSGYNLDELLPEKGFNLARALVGSEGTLVTLLEAEVELVHDPKERILVVLGYPDVYEAADSVPRVVEFGPIGLEGLDQQLIDDLRLKHHLMPGMQMLPEGGGWLLVEFGGDTRDEAEARAGALTSWLKAQPTSPHVRILNDPEEQEKLWKVREGGLGATARLPDGTQTWEGWEDSAVPPEKMGDYLRHFKKLMKRYGYDSSLYGHFGQGCLHCRLNFDLKSTGGVRKYRTFVHEAADLVLAMGGSLSGEHGDGQSRAELLPKMFGEKLVGAMREFKAIWDPENKMNPGKVVNPYRMDENLRFGPGYAPREPKTRFSFAEDKHSLVSATERCVGVGKCRREEGGTMCPSYMVTREEKHSTRGRAHLLHEMLTGEVIKDGWRSEEVKDALDLCLACKGCKGECPVNVDMATYKAEFLSHYYEGRLRPRYAYAFGFVMYVAQLGGRMPGLANFVTQTPGLRSLAKWLGGITPEREIPLFGAPSLQQRVKHAPRVNQGSSKVILWADTFNNWFHPQTGMAAKEVLETAGYDVLVPQGFHCCGRPLFDYGMVDTAWRMLGKVLRDFREEIRAGIPFVVLEPSCASTFCDELQNLFPHDLDAARLKAQTYLFPDFLAKKANGFALPKLDRKALVHGHCHHKAVLRFDGEEKVLTRLGLKKETLDSGCCGLAGSFGYEPGKYEVSQAAGERVLLPRVREAGLGTLIISDGFSCQTQIEQNTSRRALHIAEVVQMGLQQGPKGPVGELPERVWSDNGGKAALVRFRKRLMVAGIALGAALLARPVARRAWWRSVGWR